MAAMADAVMARDAKRKVGDLQSYPVDDGDTIYKGTLVSLNAAGYAVKAGDTAGTTFAGVADETADNAGGADGAVTCRVWKSGVFRFAATGADQTWVGQSACVVDNQTVALAASTTNDVVCGKVVEVVSAAVVGVRI